MRIWLVIEYGGQYEESYEKILHAYTSRKEAEKYKNKRKRAINQTWEDAKRCQECECWFSNSIENPPSCYKQGEFGDCENLVLMSPTIDAQGVYIKPLEVLTGKKERI